MKPDKQTSFTAFFKDDPFEDEKGKIPMEETIIPVKKQDMSPILEETLQADDAALRKYNRALRQYFVSGKKTTEGLQLNVAPVLLAKYLRGQELSTDFPLFFDHHTLKLQPLSTLLLEVFSGVFKEGEAKLLSENLRRLELNIQQAMELPGEKMEFSMLVLNAMEALGKLDVRGDQGEVFKTDCRKLRMQLVKKEGTLLSFSRLTGFQILNLQLAIRNERKKSFLQTLKKLHSGLSELMRLHNSTEGTDGQPKKEADLGFAGKLISFDKMKGMMPPSASSGLPEARFKRVSACAEVLKNGLNYYEESRPQVFVTKELANEYTLTETLTQAHLEIVTGSACASAKGFFDKGINSFVRIIASMRMAELEMENKFDEDLHPPYFDAFSIQNLSDEDMQHVPELIVVEQSKHLVNHPKDFLALLSANVPVRVLALTSLDELTQDAGNSQAGNFRQELASLALLYRNAYVFQAGIDTPDLLNTAFSEGLVATSPALWNLLLPTNGSTDLLALNTAIESRCFPRLKYNVQKGAQFGSRFDIGTNPQPENHFPSYPMEIKTATGRQSEKYWLTVADLLALDPSLAKEWEIIPGRYRSESHIPLAKYLSAKQEDLIGAIPFIWMLDEANTLQQAAIPFSILSQCKERLDNWQFIQELGGLNSYHVNKAIERAKAEWEAEKENEMAQLRSEMESEVEIVRKEESGKAMDRLVNVLLDLDDLPVSTPTKAPKKAAVATEVTEAKAAEPVAAAPAVEEEMSSEVWVETFRCTSCNDCTDQLPAVFKYNGDKQAEVHNPKGGTYAKIVIVAEKCPAKCIHPGLPQNKDEGGAAELIERAKAIH